MKTKTTLIIILSTSLLIFCIGAYFIYLNETRSIQNKVEESFYLALSTDMDKRLKDTSFFYSYASDSKEKTDKIKMFSSDTTTLLKKDGVDELSVEKKYMNAIQTILKFETPIDINILDSTFLSILNSHNIPAITKTIYTEKEQNIHIESEFPTNNYKIIFKTKPFIFGMTDEMSAQGFAKVPFSFLLVLSKSYYMLLAGILLIIDILIYYIFKQRNKPLRSQYDIFNILNNENSNLLFLSQTISFDPDKHVVYYKEKYSLQLTKQQGKLLNCFLKAADFYLSNQQLEISLWGTEMYSVSRRQQAINRLRDALKTIPELQIENVRGVGYQLTCADKDKE